MSAIQFLIPRVAANALDFPALRRAGDAAGLEHTWIEYSDYRVVEFGKTRITCSLEMAAEVFAALHERAATASEHGQHELAASCTAAAAATLKAITDDGDRIAHLVKSTNDERQRPKIGS